MRVIVADDAPALRKVYCRELAALGLDVIDSAGTAQDLIAMTEALRPDAVLLDICFRGYDGLRRDEDGLHVAERLRAAHPTLGIVVFSVYLTPTYVDRILRISDTHIGCLSKDRVEDFSMVADALRSTAAGGTVIDRTLSVELLRHRRARPALSELPERPRQALELLVCGLSNRAIADRMHVAERTVEKYLAEVFATLDIPGVPVHHKRVGAVLEWLRQTGALPTGVDGLSRAQEQDG
jgi:DNA-binding NarL/FixJ family response regulator